MVQKQPIATRPGVHTNVWRPGQSEMQSRRMDGSLGCSRCTYHHTAPEIKVSVRGCWLGNGVSERIATQHAEQQKSPEEIACGLHTAGECNNMAHNLL